MDTTTDAGTAALPRRRVDELLTHYGESHQNPRNEIIHFVAIPLIVISLQYLLVGPLFVLSKLMARLGVRW